ncbi:MAG: PDZ domain-containing protein [Akkermansiaceae bacterium]|jgi:predicted metalloprotease with PDZ domain|nr:PDZ domain-containing protein [Akkermansiaceae bacterium]MDP4779358.1 PDZ domain-containing protein [Akkermansiaceae bacterium]MDP4848648.1 PDZ domain-containing protein [Akkermansiaceae bacterium]MDP4896657.1 PDZ domain-containing protein [Akkermansiaceae bacterium]MDP4996408.1 PDZ domain-containing protein [Akkermansiaceae bacterium]
MKWYLPVVFLCLTGGLHAEEPLDLSVTLNRMTHDDFATRQGATDRLIEVAATRFDEVVSALFEQEKSDDPEMAHRVEVTLMRLFEIKVLGASEIDIGVDWGWHLQCFFEGEITARPIAEKVRKDSAAAKAGIKPGDLLIHVDGTPLPRRDGIRAFRAILREAKPGQVLKLKLRSSKLLSKKETSALAKEHDLTLKITADLVGGEAVREAAEGEYDQWLNELRGRLGD